ncbi:MAG: DMT family transporter [Lutispora sp.]|nr:DMT family transporter [Lutispora sp.]MDD4834907.1 DMT family transporter [Lutispora sp.]
MKETILKNQRYKSIVFLIIASILWSTGGILIKLVNWNPIAIAGSRSFISSIVVLIYLRKPVLTWSKAQLGGAIAYASTVILFVSANKLTTSANAILLQFTAPIFVAILGAWLLKEKIKWYDYLAIIAVFGGMLLFFIDNVGVGSMLGNVLAVISGFFLACVTIALRFQKDGSPVETTLIGNILTFLVAIPFIIGKVPDIQSILGIVLLGIFQLGFAYILYALAIKHLSALEAILITVIEPLLNPLWVFIFAGEKPSLYAILGGFIVIVSVTVRSIVITKESAKNNKYVSDK